MPIVNALFVCIGNSCRSQMAEGFARKYGSDVMSAWSAGLAPAPIVQPLTIEVMKKKNIDIQEQFPKSIHELEMDSFDVIFDMSGAPLRANVRGEIRVWNVLDPMMQPEEVYLQVRDQIETMVMQYILELRRVMRRESGAAQTPRPVMPRTSVVADPVKSAEDAVKGGHSSQRFGFGRVRRARD